jgi:hydrogenase expression/formation protein HypC
MCLGYPGEVVSVHDTFAVIDCWGTRKTVALETTSEVILPGDFVIEHDGIVVRRIPPDDIDRTMELYEAILAEA